jgi:hypothetical protein
VGLAPRLARQPARPATPERKEEAVRTIAHGYRAHVASKTQSAMVSSGEIWQGVEADLRQHGVRLNNERLSIEQLSSINMRALRKRLVSNGGPLNDMESAFVDRFMQQQFWATHFTSATPHVSSEHGESVSLLSGRRLVELSIPYNTGSTTLFDAIAKRDEDHVFFALECGNAPQKSKSRFGSGVYRVPFESLAASSPGVWGALDDILKAGEDVNIERAFPDFDDEEAFAVGAFVGPEGTRKHNRAEDFADVFTCEHLRAATALSLVTKFRGIQAVIGPLAPENAADPTGPHPLVQSFLASNTSDEFNKLLHTFHRIEMRVPKRFSATEFLHFDAAMLGWLKDPNATTAEPDRQRLQALVAFCSGSPADVERKLGVLCEAGIDVRAIRSDQGGSLLHLLCANDAAASAQQKQDIRSLIPALLAFGLDVNHPDASGASALVHARHDPDMLRVLLAHGAGPQAQVDQPGAGPSASPERQTS